MTLPTFQTEGLLLRARCMADLEDCLAMDRDPLVTQFIAGPWSGPTAHRAFVIARMENRNPEGLGYWSIFGSAQPEMFLGWILLLPYGASEVELGWRLTRKAWGHGYATEAASAILTHAFKTVGLRRVVADIDPRNTASIRVAEKLGMRCVEDRYIDGHPAKSYQIEAPNI